MKIWLDDERPAPEGWTRAKWPSEVIALLKEGPVEEMSLDHDLGDDERGVGMDVLVWIENEIVANKFVPPMIKVHSANPVARSRMQQAIRSIKRLAKENLSSKVPSASDG